MTKTTADGSLKMDGAPSTGTGSDAMGAYTFTDLSWDGGMFVTRFRQYVESLPNINRAGKAGGISLSLSFCPSRSDPLPLSL